MSVWIENSTIHEEPISNFCNIRFSDGEEYNLRFILNDTTKINYSYDSNGQNNNSIQSYLVVSTDTYIDASTTVSDCLRFTFLNNDKTERICIYFSNKYGFLKITKLGNYEIKKIF